jgi:hypothetical protein
MLTELQPDVNRAAGRMQRITNSGGVVTPSPRDRSEKMSQLVTIRAIRCSCDSENTWKTYMYKYLSKKKFIAQSAYTLLIVRVLLISLVFIGKLQPDV